MIARPQPAPQQDAGFTLTEVLVAMTIALFILASVFQVYINNKHTHRLQIGLSHVQENARFALEVLHRHLDAGGYAELGVTSTSPAVSGSDGGDGTPPPADTITVRYVATRDCAQRHIAPPTATNFTFSIATGLSGEPTLFCNGTELVAGVENLQIRYGQETLQAEDVNQLADQYLSADEVSDWHKVLSVRIALLISSAEQVHRQAQPYLYKDNAFYPLEISPRDRRLRRAFATTILLRNSHL